MVLTRKILTDRQNKSVLLCCSKFHIALSKGSEQRMIGNERNDRKNGKEDTI